MSNGSNLMLTGPWAAGKDLEMFLWSSSDSNYKKKSPLECLDSLSLLFIFCVYVCVCKVWGMALLNQENRLLTGSADSELRAWDINYLEEVRKNTAGFCSQYMPAAQLTVTA